MLILDENFPWWQLKKPNTLLDNKRLSSVKINQQLHEKPAVAVFIGDSSPSKKSNWIWTENLTTKYIW